MDQIIDDIRLLTYRNPKTNSKTESSLESTFTVSRSQWDCYLWSTCSKQFRDTDWCHPILEQSPRFLGDRMKRHLELHRSLSKEGDWNETFVWRVFQCSGPSGQPGCYLTHPRGASRKHYRTIFTNPVRVIMSYGLGYAMTCNTLVSSPLISYTAKAQ